MNLEDVKRALANPATTPQYRSQAMAVLKRLVAEAANPDSQQAKEMLAKETGAPTTALPGSQDAPLTPAQLAAMPAEQHQKYIHGLSQKRRSELTAAELVAFYCPQSGNQFFLREQPVAGVEALRNNYPSLVEGSEQSNRVKVAILSLGGEVPAKNPPIDISDLLKRN